MTKIKKNIYAQKAKQKALSGFGSDSTKSETKHNLQKTLAYTGRDILVGGLGGSLMGAFVGRSSLILGAVVAGTGHFLGSTSTAMFGVGMMASGGYQAYSGAVNGIEKEGMEGVKERFTNFQENIKRQLFLDKLLSKKKSDEATNGVENVQYYKHPDNADLNGGLDFTEANRLEEQISESGKQFAAKNGVGEFSGAGEEDVSGLGAIEERLF